MRKIGFTNNSSGLKEILPKSFKIENRFQQRRMFLTMLNYTLSDAALFSKQELQQCHNDLLTIFKHKIMSFFPAHKLRPMKKNQTFKSISIEQSKLYIQFLKQLQDPRARYFTRYNLFDMNYRYTEKIQTPIAELIGLIFDGKNIDMMMDLDTLFKQFVYGRIKEKQKRHTVTLKDDAIFINNDGLITRVDARWKRIQPDKLELRSQHINDGFKHLHQDGIDHCYLIYPKYDHFERHILLRDGSKKELKIIPYSFTFCNKISA